MTIQKHYCYWFYSPYCTFHTRDLFCNWKFLPLALPHLFLFFPLASSLLVATWLFSVSITLFVCSFILFFLYSTYKWNTVFLWLISLSTTEIGSSMVFQMAVFHYLMCLSNIPLCVCLCVSMCLYTHRSHIYPFIFWCAVWLLPYLGNCK